MLGKSIEHEYNLADLLRRPNVSYGGLMSLDHGKYANRDLLDTVSRETQRLKNTWISPKTVQALETERVLGKALEHEYSLYELLRRPNIAYYALLDIADGKFKNQELAQATASTTESEKHFVDSVIEQIEITAKYSGYIDKQIEEVNRSSYYEKLKLPAELDYMKVTALSIEVRQKLSAQRPETLGLASRISGITPAAVSLLLVHLKKSGYKLGAKNQKIDTPEAQSTSKDLV